MRVIGSLGVSVLFCTIALTASIHAAEPSLPTSPTPESLMPHLSLPSAPFSSGASRPFHPGVDPHFDSHVAAASASPRSASPGTLDPATPTRGDESLPVSDPAGMEILLLALLVLVVPCVRFLTALTGSSGVGFRPRRDRHGEASGVRLPALSLPRVRIPTFRLRPAHGLMLLLLAATPFLFTGAEPGEDAEEGPDYRIPYVVVEEDEKPEIRYAATLEDVPPLEARLQRRTDVHTPTLSMSDVTIAGVGGQEDGFLSIVNPDPVPYRVVEVRVVWDASIAGIVAQASLVPGLTIDVSDPVPDASGDHTIAVLVLSGVLPTSGDLYRLTFEGLQEGLSPLTLVDAILVDGDGTDNDGDGIVDNEVVVPHLEHGVLQVGPVVPAFDNGSLNEGNEIPPNGSTISWQESTRVPGLFTATDSDPCAYECPILPKGPRQDHQCQGRGSVELAGGEKSLVRVDLSIAARSRPGGYALHWRHRRRYRSRIDFNGPHGRNWEWEYNARILEQPNGDVVLLDGNGREDLYPSNADGTYGAPEGFYTGLEKLPSGGWVLRNRDGMRTFFDEDGLLDRIEDRYGDAIRFIHNATGQLTRAIDPLGRPIDYAYDAAGRLIRIEDFTGREILFSYDSDGNLVAARSPVVTGTGFNDFPDGKTERYRYSSGFADSRLNHNLLGITAPNEGAGGPEWLTFTYGTDPSDPLTFDRVLVQSWGGTNASGVPAGGTVEYVYALEGGLPHTTVEDRNGNLTEFLFDPAGRPLEVRELTRGLRPSDPAVYVTKYTYNIEGEIERIEFPEGNAVDYAYDSLNPDRLRQGDVLMLTRLPDPVRGGDQAFLRRTYVYEPVYSQMVEMVEERGNDPSYVPQNGGANTPSRYTRTWTYDYQEGDLSGLAARLRISVGDLEDALDEAGIPRNLGDRNADGVTNQFSGNIVRLDAPEVDLFQSSNQIALEGDAQQPIVSTWSYNAFGQCILAVDPEENAVTFAYHPETDPDGDGNPHPGDSGNNGAGDPLNATTGGYLATVIADAAPTGRGLPGDLGRNSGRNPAPVGARTDFLYDPVGNVIRLVDPRGVAHEFQVNALNQVQVAVRASDVSGVPARAGGAEGSTESLTGQDFSYFTAIQYDANDNVVGIGVENRDGNTLEQGAFPGVIETQILYDILDNPIRIVSEVGIDATHPAPGEFLTTEIRYDPNENPILTLLPEGNRRTVAFDERDLPLRATRGDNDTDPFNPAPAPASTVSYLYDSNGNPIEILDAEDHNGDGKPETTHLIYDGFDRLKTTRNAVGTVVERNFDPAGNVVRTRVFGRIGGPSPTDDTAAGNVLLSHTEAFFDELSRPFRVDRHLFIASGTDLVRPPEIEEGPLTPSDGTVSMRLEYDRLGRLTFGVEDDLDTTIRHYDGLSRTTRRIDAEGNEVLTFFDDNSNLVRIDEIERSPESLVPDETFTTVVEYDSLNRPVRSIDNLGHTRRTAYDSRDLPVASSDAKGPLSGETIALRPGRTVGVNAPGNTSRTFFDGLGRGIATERDLRQDGLGGNPLDTSNPSNPDGIIRTTRDYDGNSRLVSIADDNGNTTSYAYDELDRLITETFADGTTVIREFDRDHNVIRLVDNNGTVRINSFDGVNRITATDVTPAPGIIGTTKQRYQYDGLSRVTLAFDNNTPTDDANAFNDNAIVTVAYDSLSRKIEEVQYAGDVAFTPDTTDRTLSAQVSGPNEGLAVSSGWFGGSRRVAVVYPDGRRITRTFDGLDRITEIGSVRNATSELVAEYRYLGPWRVLEREYGNGTLLSYRQGSTQTGYDEGRRIVAHRHFDGSGNLLSGFAYGYDREDNRLFEEREHAASTRRGDNWTYDSAYRLTSQERDVAATAIGNPGLTTGIEARDWTLDGVGNWSELAVTPETGPTDTFAQSINEMNEYVDFGGVPQTHDENGNLTDSGEVRIEYDFLNRIRRVTRKSDNRTIAVYSYDGTGMAGRFGAGRRIRRTVTNSGSLNTDVTYFCDGPRVVEERSGDREAILRQYVDGIGLDEHLTMDVFPGAQAAGAGGNGQGQGGPPPGRGRLPAGRQRRGPPQLPPPAQAAAVRTFFFHEDGKGWVAALTDEQGNLVERVTYDSYGEPRFEDADGNALDDQSASSVGNPYLYTGRRFDPETRFYYYRHRYYRPETGRFVSRDPLGWGGKGGYEYVGGKAINSGDAWGLYSPSDTARIFNQEYQQRGAELMQLAAKKGFSWNRNGSFDHPGDRPWSFDYDTGLISIDAFYDDKAAEYLYEALLEIARMPARTEATHGEVSSDVSGNPTYQTNREAVEWAVENPHESIPEGTLAIAGADAFVVSVSGYVNVVPLPPLPPWIAGGAEGGVEWVYICGQGWYTLGQLGGGVGTPGGGLAVEAGVIYGLDGDITRYTEHFIEGQAACGPISGSAFFDPTGKGVWGFKGGWNVFSNPGAGAYYEYYWLLDRPGD